MSTPSQTNAGGRAPRAWLVIARREFFERVRTGWFLVTTILGPLGLLGVIVLPAWLGQTTGAAEVRVLDRSEAELGAGVAWAVDQLSADVNAEPAEAGTSEDELRARVEDGDIAGYLVVPSGALDGETVVYWGRNAADMQFVFTLREVVNMALRSARAEGAGFSRTETAALLGPASFEARHAARAGEPASGTGSFVVGYAVMFITYMAILLYAVNVLRSVVQEKTTRAVEMIVSATRSNSLMVGKIAGVGAVGLFQLAIWALLAFAMLAYQDELLAAFGIAEGGFDVPAIQPAAVAVSLGYFLLGYALYASLYAAIGAMVTSDQEAQQAQTPVVVVLVIPLACVNLVVQDPGGTIAQVLTTVPFSAPVLMPMRYLLGGAGAGDVAVSMGVLALAIACAVWLAARIYRVGILSHGKRPSLRELSRWVRR